jgi:DNA modification methylase
MIGPYKCCSVVCGDCLELMKALPDGCVDAVITDPPYGVGKIYDSYDDTKKNLENMIPYLFIAPKVVITPGVNNIHSYPKPEWVLCWWKPNAMVRSAVANCNVWEPILVYGCGYFFGRDGIEICISPQLIDHPCPKPLRLFEWLISKVEATTILDPFAGSGTTLVAAKKLGRHYLGFEISPDYVRISRERLSLVDAQPSLFEQKPEQMELL